MIRRRGGIDYAEFEFGRRPVLVVSWNAINSGMRQPICALVTTTARDRTIPTYVEVDPTESGLDEMSFVLCHPLVTKDERDMDAQPVGDLGYPKIHEVELALARALDLTGANEPRTG